tara:strand:- start:16328 stop:17062 length:735 start_codon:yes stop_codon:yes gene_type:complete
LSDGVRINKFLASCGLGSRRGCEEIVSHGRVTVNGKVVTDLATRILPDDAIKVDGKRVWSGEETTILLYKPKGHICTKEDTHDRTTIYDLLPGRFQRLNYVGRLDKESEGLLLLTSSGEVSQTLTHPKHKIEKEYEVVIDRPLEKDHAEKMVEGIHTAEGIATAERVEVLGQRRVSVVLKQGLKRQIRLMFGKFDYKVKKLVRVRIGELIAPTMKAGDWVELDEEGIELAMTNPPKPKKPKDAV